MYKIYFCQLDKANKKKKKKYYLYRKVLMKVLVAQSCLTFVTPCTAALQAPLSMWFSRQEYWSGFPFPSPGDLSDPELNPSLPHCRFFTVWTTREAFGLPCPPPGDLPNPGFKPRFPTLQEDSSLSEPPGKPKNTGVGRLSLFQGTFLTHESN